MFDLTNFLKGYGSRIQWNSKISKYIKASGKLTEFNKGKHYSCNVETAIGFVKSLDKLDEVLKLAILNELLERRVLELKSEAMIMPAQATSKQNKTLESDHFNAYGVNSISELATNIVEDIRKAKPENIKHVFKDYVYFFTYFYKYNSIRTHVSAIRKAIKESDLPDEKKEIGVAEFKFSDRVHDWINEGGHKNRVKNMTEVLRPIEVSFLSQFVKKANKYTKSKINKENKKIAFTHLTAMISLSIGRRLTEIISQSEVSKVSEFKVRVKGLGKKREDEPVEIIVPTLFLSADEVIEAIAKVRSIMPKGLRVQADRDKHAHNLADFKLLDKRLWVQYSKFDSVRAIYAIVSELIYNQNNIVEENRKPQATYIQKVLGHGEENFTTYQHYYKRQVLLKGFDLDSYLQRSKTAML